MKRYTQKIRGNNGVFLKRNSDEEWSVSVCVGGKDYTVAGEFVDRLSDYEDTGLLPDEVLALKNKAKKLAALCRDLEEDLVLNVQEHAACMCDYCANKEYCVSCRQYGMCVVADFEWARHNELIQLLETVENPNNNEKGSK